MRVLKTAGGISKKLFRQYMDGLGVVCVDLGSISGCSGNYWFKRRKS